MPGSSQATPHHEASLQAVKQQFNFFKGTNKWLVGVDTTAA
jgi:hypothetical protein